MTFLAYLVIGLFLIALGLCLLILNTMNLIYLSDVFKEEELSIEYFPKGLVCGTIILIDLLIIGAILYFGFFA